MFPRAIFELAAPADQAVAEFTENDTDLADALTLHSLQHG